MPSPAEFLTLLFSHVPPGCLEIRVIEDKKEGDVIDRRWFETAQALVGAVSELNRLAEAKNAGVLFGVLPRKAPGLGTADATLSGLVAWADLDFRDYKEGEVEARRILGAFPLPPSIVVFSGHGVHPYWLMREPTDPGALSRLSKGLGIALHGDHVADAPRMLRLPGTMNRKDPSHPIQVVVEQFEPGRCYNPGDLDEHLDAVIPKALVVGAISGGAVKIGGNLGSRVLQVLNSNSKIQALFEGRGKTALTESGKRTDTSSSGYDYSVITALARKGIRDESDLATVLWLRPDETARLKGTEYILRTIRRAVADVVAGERCDQAGPITDSADFTVQRLRVFDSNPRKYEFTVDGVPFAVSTPELLAPGRFRVRFMDALGRVPILPRGGASWTELVKSWLESAEIIEQPPEASPTGFLKDAIVRAIAELCPGENADDLDRGKSLHHKGQLVFKTVAIWQFLKENLREESPRDICPHLQDLGFAWITPRIDGKGVRVWARDLEVPAGSPGEETRELP